MTYEQAIDFWYSRINYEQRMPQPGDFKLDRMRALLRLLGDPQEQLRIIHVAGSKGKGSTAAMLACILRHAGYRTGLFTSPHLCRVEERIQVDEQPISAAELTALLVDVQTAIENRGWRMEDGTSNSILHPPSSILDSPSSILDSPSSPHSATFFEIATALGFLHFARRRVDVAVVEVGLGGRFDSTNVCWPVVSIITSISFDHTRLLGNRLAAIAMEKAGIVKPGRPTISGATAPEARDVIEQICRSRHSPLQQLGVDFHYRYTPGEAVRSGGGVVRKEVEMRMEDGGWRRSGNPCLRTSRPLDPTIFHPPRRLTHSHQRKSGPHHDESRWPRMQLGLLGKHQAANAAVAVACIEQLRRQDWHIGDDAVANGLANVCWPARLEIVGQRPFVVLDCAHNVASAEALVATLQSSFPPARRLLIFAGSNDKDLPGMFQVLAPHFAHAFLTCHGNSARNVPVEQLAGVCRSHGELPFTLCPTPAAAWHAARGSGRSRRSHLHHRLGLSGRRTAAAIGWQHHGGIIKRRQGDKETRRRACLSLLVSLSPCLLVCLFTRLASASRAGEFARRA